MTHISVFFFLSSNQYVRHDAVPELYVNESVMVHGCRSLICVSLELVQTPLACVHARARSPLSAYQMGDCHINALSASISWRWHFPTGVRFCCI